MTETVRRLAPTQETIRRLYLMSGNECAFPGCSHRIIDETGLYVAQICHIEAAELGGPRFNPEMTNEQRRSYENLVLLCYPHHKATDNEKEFSVTRLRGIKADHERRYLDAEKKILQAPASEIYDETDLHPYYAVDAEKVLGYDELSSEKERLEHAAQLDDFVVRLRRVPRRTRQVLRVVVERSSSDMAFQNPEVSYAELLNAVALNYGSLEEASQDLFAHIEVLRKYGFVHVEEGGFPLVYLYWIFSEWPGWDTLRERCAARGATLTDVIVELRFDFLEESS